MFNEDFAGILPLTGSDIAVRWNSLYNFVIAISIFFFVLIVGGMIYFLYAYKHQANRKTKYITGNHLLEALWIAIPTLMLLVIFAWGYSVYRSMTQAPADSYEVRVIGKQWLWTFQYDDGRTSVSEVYVPLNRPVKFIMTSEDVLHGFFIPNFRIKQDVVPGMYTSLWFTATVPGKHQVFCTEYCGTSHSQMLAKVIVLDDAQWKKWIRNEKLPEIADAAEAVEESLDVEEGEPKVVARLTLVDQGKQIFKQKGCATCHNTETDEVRIGPSMKGIYGTRVDLADGKTALVDDTFILKHIENPRATTLRGYSPDLMPTFKGIISESEMNALIAFIKSLKE